MKKTITTLFSSALALGFLGSCATSSQYASTQVEPDDMYFTANDRAAIEPQFTKLNDKQTADYNRQGSYQYQDEELSSKTVNPDVIAQYNNNNQQNTKGETVNEDYYVPEYDRVEDQPTIVNNYYGNDRRYSNFGSPFYGGGFGGFYDPFYDPFFDPYYNSFAFGGDPFWNNGFYGRRGGGWGRPGFNMSIGFGFGNAWGSPWGWGGNRWGRGFHDPFWGNPYQAGFYNGLAYGGGFGGFGYGRPSVVVINNGEQRQQARRVRRGPTQSMNSSLQRERIARDAATNPSGSRSQIRSNRSSSGRQYSSTSGTSNVTSSQNERYRSRTSSEAASAYRRQRAAEQLVTRGSGRSSSNSRYSAQPRTNRSSQVQRTRDYSSRRSTPSYSNSRSRSTSRGSSYSNSSSPSRSYSRSSSSSSRSYSTPSSSPSRSSGSSSSGSRAGSRSRGPR